VNVAEMFAAEKEAARQKAREAAVAAQEPPAPSPPPEYRRGEPCPRCGSTSRWVVREVAAFTTRVTELPPDRRGRRRFSRPRIEDVEPGEDYSCAGCVGFSSPTEVAAAITGLLPTPHVAGRLGLRWWSETKGARPSERPFAYLNPKELRRLALDLFGGRPDLWRPGAAL
jgi:hypothetical protein